MEPPEHRHYSIRSDELARSGEPRVVEEVLIGHNAPEHEGEHRMGVDHETGVTSEYKGYQALVERAVDVFGDELIASRWLSMPSADLKGAVPLQVAQGLEYDPARVQAVFEPIFVRIEHGIYF